MRKQEIIKKLNVLKPIYNSLGMNDQSMALKLDYIEKAEMKLHGYAEMYASLPLSETTVKKHRQHAKELVHDIEEMLPVLEGKIVWNLDPRGYALKVDSFHIDETLENKSKLRKDMGGNMLIAPSSIDC